MSKSKATPVRDVRLVFHIGCDETRIVKTEKVNEQGKTVTVFSTEKKSIPSYVEVKWFEVRRGKTVEVTKRFDEVFDTSGINVIGLEYASGPFDPLKA